RSCAAELLNKLKNSLAYARCMEGPILVCAGSGNNGADALVMLRALINSQQLTIGISGTGTPYNAAVLLSRFPSVDETTPRSAAVKALQAMGVPVVTWNGKEQAAELFRNARLIIDGIAGTGLKNALEGIPLEMLQAINERRNAAQCCVVSIDVPSGACSNRKPDFPIIHADYTLAVEPLKTVLYTPAIRPYCGQIIPVRGIFPARLLEKYIDAELLHWEAQCNVIPPVPPDAYKYSRGVVTIHAGSPGTLGAARIAAAGASASGAGMVRLILDDDVYPVLASVFGGIMAVPASGALGDKNSFVPYCLLLGPGWGRGKDRLPILQQALKAEETGTPLILDADGIYLLKTLIHDITAEKQNDTVFHGRAILTPHAGELEAFSGIPKEQLLSDPLLVVEQAKKLNAVILFKSHVMIVASPDGRLGFIDGMDPSLGAGGSGDLLAGLCAGIAGRIRAGEKPGKGSFDPYLVAAAAGTLLFAAARQMGQRFYDPLELAEPASVLAGRAWLPEKSGFS
ncbi:MAG: bifunctional ADP-dependent NAD(P)H-hydrate dehydratase/NAD(P)H-hydrate epimerase, partial [Treponema sp.]|nr:bifunctional ADP-dependent NAD(P)H-hydrate dehydratase/NAD(P)H-hydrate epimerase [Treponema sp.]